MIYGQSAIETGVYPFFLLESWFITIVRRGRGIFANVTTSRDDFWAKSLERIENMAHAQAASLRGASQELIKRNDLNLSVIYNINRLKIGAIAEGLTVNIRHG